MQRVNSKRHGKNRGAILAAASLMVWAGSAFAQTSLYFDLNGTSSGVGSGTGTWNANAATNWNTVSAGTGTPGTWLQSGQTLGSTDFNIANFNAALTANVSGTVDLSGLNFNSGNSTVGFTFDTNNNPTGTLNFGTNNLAINIASGTQQIFVPLTGSGNIIYTYNGSATFNVGSSLSGFTGNLYINNGTASRATMSSLQLNTIPGNPNATIYVDANVKFANDNQLTLSNGTKTSLNLTLPNPIILNYGGASATPLNGAIELIYSSNGLDSSSTDSSVMSPSNEQSIAGSTAGTAMIENWSGNISSPSGVTTNVVIGTSTTGSGGRGAVILSGNNSWNGFTLITEQGSVTTSTGATGNGFVQLGSSTAIPSGTNLIFSVGNSSVAPFDLNGNNLTVAALTTGSTYNTIIANSVGTNNGNIYNLNAINGGTGATNTSAKDVTITVGSSTPSVYKGDIGCTDLNVHPFDNQTPYLVSNGSGGYNFGVQANTDISLKLNGPAPFVLAPVSNEPSGDEYTGTTSVNGGTLVFGRASTYSGGPGVGIPSGNNTITGGGDVTVVSGAAISSLASNATTYIGGAAGNINLMSGSQLNPGQATVSGTISTTTTNYTVTLSPNNVGTLDTNTINFNQGASMSFSIATPTSYDYLVFNSALNLDSSNGGHTININLVSGKNLDPGTYILINGLGTINGDGSNGDGTSTGFVLGTIPSGYSDYTFKLLDVGNDLGGNSLELKVTAPSLQWDPNETGNGGAIQETGGEWTDGTGSDGQPAAWFYDSTPGHVGDTPWVNGTNKEVIIGNDPTQQGGTITLGSPISLVGMLTFGGIAPGHDYVITNGSTNCTLSLGGGISVLNAAATSTTASAEIDAPIVLTADQTWDVPSGQFLDIKGAVTGAVNLTQQDGGVIDIENGNGGSSLTSLNLNGGVMLFGSPTAVGGTPITLNGGALEVTTSMTLSNTLAFGASGGSLGAAQASGGPAVALTLPSITTTNPVTIIGTGTVNLAASNTFSGGLTIANGTVPVTAAAQLGSGTSVMVSGGTLALTGITTLTDNINTGTSASGGGTISDTVPLTFNMAGTGSGVLQLVNSSATTPQFTINVTGTATTGAIASPSAATVIDVKGGGTLTVGGYSGSVASAAGSSLIIDQGIVSMTSTTALGGASSLNITVNSAGELDFAWTNNAGRTGGSFLINGGVLKRINGLSTTTNSETSVSAATASDIITFTGNTKIWNATILPGNVDQILGTTNPIVLTTGTTLTAQIDNPNGFGGNSGIDFRGPTASTNLYDTFVMQSGSSLIQTGPGELRFGRVNSQGMPIIAEGAPGADVLIRLGQDCYLMDNPVASNTVVNTEFIVDGTGNAGLRIEASMDAVYVDPGTNPPASAAIGTTGLFGADPYAGQTNHTSGNVFTVLSPNRLMDISNTYNDGTTTFTPSGTLTLAANDAGAATGLINAGPAAPCAVTLALDNTSTSSGKHIYQIDPADPQGGNFANFAGLTVERTNSSGATVTAQLLGTTKIPSLTITGGTNVDIQTDALAVDPGTGTAPTATIRGYLISAYDGGKWDTTGIGSSSVSSQLGTSIGYLENDLLPVASQYATFDGQTVSTSAVLVKYTWMGDLNLDGVVNNTDLGMMGALGTGNVGWMGGDLNYDNTVNADDWSLFMLGNAAQTGTLNSAVPEPAVGGMLLLGAIGLASRRRRR